LDCGFRECDFGFWILDFVMAGFDAVVRVGLAIQNPKSKIQNLKIAACVGAPVSQSKIQNPKSKTSFTVSAFAPTSR
jgi:hypothetical protein